MTGYDVDVAMRWRLLLVLLTIGIAASAAAAPLEIYGRLPSASHVEISPDGSRIAVVTDQPDGQQIRIVKADDLSFLSGYGAGDIKIIGLQWIGATHLLVVYSRSAIPVGLAGRRGEFWLVLDINLRTGKTVTLLSSGRSFFEPANFVSAWPQPAIKDNKPIAILSVPFTGILRDDLDSGRTSYVKFSRYVPDLDYSVLDRAGEPVAQVGYDAHNGEWTLWTRTKEDWKQRLRETHLIDIPEVRGVTPKEDALIIEDNQDGVAHYRELSLTDGTVAPVPLMQGGSPVFGPAGREVIGAEIETPDGIHYNFFDPQNEQLWQSIVRAFPGEIVRLASWSDDWSKVILQVEGAKSGAAFYLLDMKTRHADWIADEHSGITADNVAEVRTIHYAAADGLDIPAYLTLPRGVPAKALPLVVLVHGGPAGHDRPGFDWWSQAIASLGYAVLQPQFRGSDDNTPGFLTAGYGQWGRKMQTDLSDGVRFLAANGTIDPNRVCIAGASYGGYAAMAGVTLQTGIYRCAIAVSGLSDLRRHLTDTAIAARGTDNPTRRYWLRFIGAQDASDPIVHEMSPIRHLDRLSVPLLLIHGSIDTVVQPAQSKTMFEAATKAGKQVSYVTLQGEDHNLARGATRLQMLQAMADFLKTNLPVAAVPPAQ